MSGLVVRLGSGGVGFGGRGGFWDGFGEEDAGELIVDLIEELLNPASRQIRRSGALTSGLHASLSHAGRGRRRACHPSGTAYRALRRR
jgi:hypothetical protein